MTDICAGAKFGFRWRSSCWEADGPWVFRGETGETPIYEDTFLVV